MWIVENDKLKCVTDESRAYFRTTISSNLLERLKIVAENHDTHINYLLENGLQQLLKESVIVYDKKQRPKDRTMYKTTFDKDLIKEFRKFAKEHKLCANDVIEHSEKFINIDNVKSKSYRSRIML